jgi:small neutral amino acid transporter SnatA (MarC family)
MPVWLGVLATASAVAATIVCVVLLKVLHDRVANQYSQLTERYIDIVGRLSALVIGTFAVDMLLQGIDHYLAQAAFRR